MKANFRHPFLVVRFLIVAAVFCFAWMARPAQAQCLYAGYGLAPSTVFIPQCSGTAEFITTARSSSYSLVVVTPGVAYTFTSSVITDLVTLGNKAGTMALASGTGSVTYTAPAYDTLRFYTHANAQCSDTPSNRTRRISCIFPQPSNNACTAAAILTNAGRQQRSFRCPGGARPGWLPRVDVSTSRAYRKSPPLDRRDERSLE